MKLLFAVGKLLLSFLLFIGIFLPGVGKLLLCIAECIIIENGYPFLGKISV